MRSDLLNPTQNQSPAYNQNLFSIIGGRIANKNFSGGRVAVGPLLNSFANVQIDSALTTVAGVYATPNGRVFILSNLAASSAAILLYTYSYTSGTFIYNGRINIQIPGAGAPTLRGFRVDDSDAGNIRIFIAATQTAGNAVFGGQYMVNRIVPSDFVLAAFPTIPYGTGNDQKAVYFLQNPSAFNNAHTMQAAIDSPMFTNLSRIYMHNGTAAVHQYNWWNYSTAPDNVGTTVGSFTIASPGKVNITAHPFANNNDAVVFSTTGTLPTGIVAGTVYFVRNRTANDFEISATSGGVSINFTGSPTGVATVRPAYGMVSNLPFTATGNLPAVLGTLNSNSAEAATPQNIVFGAANQNQDCISFVTTTNLYIGRISDLTSGGTTWPNLVTSNVAGGASEFTALTASLGNFSQQLDAFVFFANGSVFVKRTQNNVMLASYGRTSVQQLRLAASDYQPVLGQVAVTSMDVRLGVVFLGSSSADQVGVISCDISSDDVWEQQAIITPVLSTPYYAFRSIVAELLSSSDGCIQIDYRTSGFGVETGGWIPLDTSGSMLTVGQFSQIQYRIRFCMRANAAARPPQVQRLYQVFELLGDSSSNWAFSFDNSSSGSPTRFAFELIRAYPTSVPTLRLDYFDTNNPATLLGQLFSTTDSVRYQYSTNNGLSWVSLGTIPNVVGTLVRITPAAPPGVKVFPALREA